MNGVSPGGIAVIVFCGQLNEFVGLGLKMPDHVPHRIAALARHLSGIHWRTLAIGAMSLAILYAWPRVSKKVPASIVAVIVTALVAHFAGWPVATIGSKFGGIPPGLPGWHFPAMVLFLRAVQPQPMKVMFESGLVDRLGEHKFCADLDEALSRARRILAG